MLSSVFSITISVITAFIAVLLSITIIICLNYYYHNAECCIAKCRYAQCRGIAMPSQPAAQVRAAKGPLQFSTFKTLICEKGCLQHEPNHGTLTGKLCTVDLLELTSSDRLLLKLQTFFTFFKQVTLMRRSTVLSLPFSQCSLVLLT